MQLAKKVAQLLADKADTDILEYADVPFMNQDYEFPTPESVQKARQAVLNADGIWMFTPEYNYQIPGVLKNLLDWLSRPVSQDDTQRNSVLKNKPVTVSGVAGKSGAAGARKNLSALAQSMRMKLIAGEGSGISLDSTAWSTDVLNLSEEDIEMLKKQVELFIESI
jgi:NAD(P)H-dependent FMN reductase